MGAKRGMCVGAGIGADIWVWARADGVVWTWVGPWVCATAGFVGVAVVSGEADEDGGMGLKRKRCTWPLGIAACISC